MRLALAQGRQKVQGFTFHCVSSNEDSAEKKLPVVLPKDSSWY